MYDTAAFKMSLLSDEATFNQAICGIKPNDKINLLFLYSYFFENKDKYLNDRVGVRQRNLSKDYISSLKIPLPKLEIQNDIANEFKIEISRNKAIKDLKKNYESIINKKINKLWTN